MWKIAFLLYYISNETTSLAASWGLLATCYDPGADLTEQKQVVTHGHLANKLEGEPSQISDGKKVKAHFDSGKPPKKRVHKLAGEANCKLPHSDIHL